MNIWNRLPCSAVSHVVPSVDNFHKFAIPAIRDMQPLYGAVLIKISYECFPYANSFEISFQMRTSL